MRQRSNTTSPNRPLRSNSSVALKARSTSDEQRTHKRLRRTIPAFVAEEISSESLVSINAHRSFCDEAARNADNINEVLPEECAPTISVMAPAGKPPVMESIAEIPDGNRKL